VPQHTQKQVAGLVHLGTVKPNRFRERLVDRLVEADDVVQMWDFGLTIVDPEAKNAGAQRSILRNELASGGLGARPIDFSAWASLV